MLDPTTFLHRLSAAALVFLALACLAPRARAVEPPQFAATIVPLGMILNELTSGSAQVHVLLPVGASPHTYDPRPSDASAAERALAVFYVAENLDGWATRLPAKERISVLKLIPAPMYRHFAEEHAPHDTEHDHDHAHSGVDPHFWSDPLAVVSLIEPLAAELARLDPAHAAQYRANAAAFAARMTALDAELKTQLEPVRGKGVILFHPSLVYLLQRYGIVLLGVIEPAPGREPTPRELQRLGKIAEQSATRALFTEPQLPRRPAEIIAENTGCKLYELDPNGGTEGRRTLEQLLRYNAGVLREALQ